MNNNPDRMDFITLYLPAEGRSASYDLFKAQSHVKTVGYTFACTGSKMKN